jgi:hypothetical protein
VLQLPVAATEPATEVKQEAPAQQQAQTEELMPLP